METGTSVDTGEPIIENYPVFTMIGRNGHVTVKYGERDSHSIKSLLSDLQADILATFGIKP